MINRISPFLLVFIWSSGFVVARLTVPHAAPQLILLARMGMASMALGMLAVASGATWPRGRPLALNLIAGALLNGVYLCVNWWAVARGMPVGIVALLGALQPLVVAVGAFLLFREVLPLRVWVGLAVGLTGVVLVLAPLLASGRTTSVPVYVVAGAVVSILAISAGTMIQSGSLKLDNILVSTSLQNLGGTLVALVATAAQGDYHWDNTLELWLGLLWAVVPISMLAISLLVWMTRHQGSTRVSLLLLMPPPLAAVEAHFLFGEHLSSIQAIGFAVALGGLLMARSKRAGSEMA